MLTRGVARLRTTGHAAAFALCASWPWAQWSHSEVRAETGVELAARVGVSHAYGAVDGSAEGALDAFVERQVPLQLDLGYRISALWFVGVYGSFGVGDFGRSWHDLCELSGEDFGSRYECAARVYRLGAQGQYRLFAGEPIVSPSCQRLPASRCVSPRVPRL